MSNKLGLLSEDEVRQVARIVEALDHSTFDYLQLELGDLKLTIGKGAGVPLAAPAAAVPVAAAPVAAMPAAPASLAAPAPAPAPIAAPAPAAVADGTVAITSPIMGRFYAQPEPGAPPFVAVGMSVTEDTTVGLVEVMKVFNAITARVRGVVTEICIRDADLIEFGQVMYRVRPVAA